MKLNYSLSSLGSSAPCAAALLWGPEPYFAGGGVALVAFIGGVLFVFFHLFILGFFGKETFLFDQIK